MKKFNFFMFSLVLWHGIIQSVDQSEQDVFDGSDETVREIFDRAQDESVDLSAGNQTDGLGDGLFQGQGLEDKSVLEDIALPVKIDEVFDLPVASTTFTDLGDVSPEYQAPQIENVLELPIKIHTNLVLHAGDQALEQKNIDNSDAGSRAKMDESGDLSAGNQTDGSGLSGDLVGSSDGSSEDQAPEDKSSSGVDAILDLPGVSSYGIAQETKVVDNLDTISNVKTDIKSVAQLLDDVVGLGDQLSQDQVLQSGSEVIAPSLKTDESLDLSAGNQTDGSGLSGDVAGLGDGSSQDQAPQAENASFDFGKNIDQLLEKGSEFIGKTTSRISEFLTNIQDSDDSDKQNQQNDVPDEFKITGSLDGAVKEILKDSKDEIEAAQKVVQEKIEMVRSEVSDFVDKFTSNGTSDDLKTADVSTGADVNLVLPENEKKSDVILKDSVADAATSTHSDYKSQEVQTDEVLNDKNIKVESHERSQDSGVVPVDVQQGEQVDSHDDMAKKVVIFDILQKQRIEEQRAKTPEEVLAKMSEGKTPEEVDGMLLTAWVKEHPEDTISSRWLSVNWLSNKIMLGTSLAAGAIAAAWYYFYGPGSDNDDHDDKNNTSQSSQEDHKDHHDADDSK